MNRYTVPRRAAEEWYISWFPLEIRFHRKSRIGPKNRFLHRYTLWGHCLKIYRLQRYNRGEFRRPDRTLLLRRRWGWGNWVGPLLVNLRSTDDNRLNLFRTAGFCNTPTAAAANAHLMYTRIGRDISVTPIHRTVRKTWRATKARVQPDCRATRTSWHCKYRSLY